MLAAVLVLIVVLILVVLVVILVLIAVLILVLIVVHNNTSVVFLRTAARVVYPVCQALSFALNKRLTISPAVIAAVIPPAVAFRPPVRMPRKPSCMTASFTPFASK